MVKFCPECGKKTISDSAKFCAECGMKFTNVETPGMTDPITPSPPPPPIISYNSVMSPMDNVPEAAKGQEAEKLYASCISRVKSANPSAVPEFKSNCKAFGLSKLSAQDFHNHLVQTLGREEAIDFVPQLVRLVPNREKRAQLIQYNTRCSRDTNDSRSSSSSMSSAGISNPEMKTGVVSEYSGLFNTTPTSSFRGVGMGEGKSNPEAKTGVVSRYADHPKCDICNSAFELAKRRHQCRACGLYVCSSCSPAKLLIPPGQEIKDAKGYDTSIPQRVCIQCAPRLHDVQDDLARTYGQFNNANPHEAKGRIHAPYSSSLEKECRNASDIIGNFFRPEWGASKDRSIPVKFLERAHGIAVMTIIKAGFLITGKIGTGLVIAKLPDGSWSAPSALGTAGLGGGLEIGGEIVELMIILGSPGAVRVFHKPQLNVGAGLDLAVGPYGRSADAVASASASGLNANYSYSHSKGLYAGISLQGAVITARKDVNTKFYSREVSPKSILIGEVEKPRAAQPLYDALERAMQGVIEHRTGQEQAIQARGPCNFCGCVRFVPHTTQVWNKNCKTCKHVH